MLHYLGAVCRDEDLLVCRLLFHHPDYFRNQVWMNVVLRLFESNDWVILKIKRDDGPDEHHRPVRDERRRNRLIRILLLKFDHQRRTEELIDAHVAHERQHVAQQAEQIPPFVLIFQNLLQDKGKVAAVFF